MTIQIRPATEADAIDAISTLRRSITELCVVDHKNDPAEIEDWLSNKTEDAWRTWTARDDAIVLVAEHAGNVIGVGMATLDGDILLNYVHPSARFQGISKAILASIEEVFKSRGLQHCRLESTVTAYFFYESCGYRHEAGSDLMSKSL
ncbi:MAG: GNAT family N-acetyltransferase [Oceanicola sp.]|nr:GNAT family N-acetyltransferase [Oceanicola sp.]